LSHSSAAMHSAQTLKSHTALRSFIRAFTDRPQAVASGFNKVERIMKSLFLKRLYLWPRFQLQVSSALEANPPEVVDIRMPLSPAMIAIQEAIIQVGSPSFSSLSQGL
jgi:DNA excision repair protein ERCC-4